MHANWKILLVKSTKQNHMQMTTHKVRLKFMASLNVLFYKWLGYPAGIIGWQCAAVTTASITPTHACLSTGASPQKSNVRCYPSPLIEGARGSEEPRKTTITGLVFVRSDYTVYLFHVYLRVALVLHTVFSWRGRFCVNPRKGWHN